MIIKASQRGGARALAAHLLNIEDNEHIAVQSVEGFMATDILGAFEEIEAMARGTMCKQPLFSVSLSPPKDAKVSEQDFRDAACEVLQRNGLDHQPHVLIFHEKHGRRHAHLVASRIEVEKLTAINLPFFKERLMELSRELYVTHGWDMPKDHEDRSLSDPKNYSLEELQVAVRRQRDPQKIKAALQTAWASSDGLSGFRAALSEAGFMLARGDRRGFVAVDANGTVYSLSRWLGVKTRELKSRLGDPEALPGIQAALFQLENHNFEINGADSASKAANLTKKIDKLLADKAAVISAHRKKRVVLRSKHDGEVHALMRSFAQSQSPLRRLFNWTTGQSKGVVALHKAQLADLRHRQELEELALSTEQCAIVRGLREHIKALEHRRDDLLNVRSQAPAFDLVRSDDPEALFTASEIRRRPDRVLEVLTDKNAKFSRNDIRRALARFIFDKSAQAAALEKVLGSTKLVQLDADEYTTRLFQAMEQTLSATVEELSQTRAFGVSPASMRSAIKKQNKKLQEAVGASLSDEQVKAIEHVLNRRQFAAVVGCAGAGKSTMLSAANDAWSRQGYRVLGGALAGKAADGLQSASGIPSRTLASWEMSWKNDRNRLQAGDVFVIDEAGMIGSAQMSRIVKEARKRRAKLVLVGDPGQLQPINAGTPFGDIVKKLPAARLAEIRRQKVDWQRQASLDLAEGRFKEAWRAYEDAGAVTKTRTQKETIAALVEAYMADWELHGTDKTRIALVYRPSGICSG